MTISRAARSSQILILALLAFPISQQSASRGGPHVVLISVDTLRADRMSSYGYERPTSPNIDNLLEAGVRFERARVVEPLTNPSMCSIFTSLFPHQHGASRNGLRMYPKLDSLPKSLRASGYRTAAFVGNWTLRDKLSGLGEHFEYYEEILNRKRWAGFIRGEATAEDLTDRASEYLAEHVEDYPSQPLFLWVHYVEPHAPYIFQKDFAEPLGLDPSRKPKPRDRYDTEVAFVDHNIGRLVEAIEDLVAAEEVLVVFVSDHGESLGEHSYWGHGRHLYEPTLWVPMGLRWTGHVSPRTIASSALSIDLAPTVLRLLGLDVPASFEGFDWTGVLDGADAPEARVTQFQAHKGAVISKHESERARASGLLAVARVRAERKEIYRVDGQQHLIFDLSDDPAEEKDLAEGNHLPTESLMSWIVEVHDALTGNDIPDPLDEESIERLRALGYVD